MHTTKSVLLYIYPVSSLALDKSVNISLRQVVKEEGRMLLTNLACYKQEAGGGKWIAMFRQGEA